MALSKIDSASLNSGIIIPTQFAPNAISTNTITSTGKVSKFNYGNAPPNQQPITASITLSAAEAPIGSFVGMSVEVMSGASGGQQYCYLYARSGTSGSSFITAWTTGWYWYDVSINWFYIRDEADRTFAVSHGTISATTNQDSRSVYYHGYLKVTQ